MFDAKKILLLLALSSASLQAQQSISPAQPSATAVAEGRAGLFTIPEAQLRTTVPQIHHQYLGLGGALLRDTYLSPLRYGGKAISYISEVTRLGYQRRADSVAAAGSLFSYHGRQADQRWRRHTLLTVDLGLTTNPAGNASIYTLQGRYDWGYLRQLYNGKWGTLSVGGSLSALAGVRYSTRNGNNPASLDFGLSIGPSLLYSKRLGGEKLPMLAKPPIRASRHHLLPRIWRDLLRALLLLEASEAILPGSSRECPRATAPDQPRPPRTRLPHALRRLSLGLPREASASLALWLQPA